MRHVHFFEFSLLAGFLRGVGEGKLEVKSCLKRVKGVQKSTRLELDSSFAPKRPSHHRQC